MQQATSYPFFLKVHAGGSGLERGVQGQPTDFNVWTREAGHGSLAISVEGPSKAIVDFKVRMTLPPFSSNNKDPIFQMKRHAALHSH